jgi:hypothetical protein
MQDEMGLDAIVFVLKKHQITVNFFVTLEVAKFKVVNQSGKSSRFIVLLMQDEMGLDAIIFVLKKHQINVRVRSDFQLLILQI